MGDVHAQFCHVLAVAAVEAMPLPQRRHTAALTLGEIGDGGDGDIPLLRRFQYGEAQGMTAGLLHRSGEAEKFRLFNIIAGHVGEAGLALRHRARLIQDHRFYTTHQLQRGGGANQDALLGGLARAHHDGNGGGKSQCAGTGDNENGNSNGDGKVDVLPACEAPQQRGGSGNDHHHGDEDAADLIGEAGDGGFARGGLLHQTDDLGEGGIIPHRRGGELHVAAAKGGGGGDGIAHGLFHRHTLTRQRRLVHRAAACAHHAVHTNSATLSDDDGVTHADVLCGDGHLPALTAHHGRGGDEG